jgi:hypothetical protein
MNELQISVGQNTIRLTSIGGPRNLRESPLDLLISVVKSVWQLFLSLILPSATAIPESTHPAYRSIKNLGQRGHQLGTETIQLYSEKLQTEHKNVKLVTSAYASPTKTFSIKEVANVTETRLSIPVIVKGSLGLGDHIVHLFVEKRDGGVMIDFFDSHALDLAHPNNAAALNIVKELTGHFKMDVNVTESSQRRQFGGNTCGLWILKHLELRLSGQFINEVEAPDIEIFRIQVANSLATLA